MPNKAQFIETLAQRLDGDKKRAAAALDAVIETIYSSVSKGERVALTGFGVFEKRDRAARTARNPATGETVRVKKTSVPAFRAGAEFKAITSGAKKLAKAPAKKAGAGTAAKRTAGAGRGTSAATGTATKTAGRAASKSSAATKAPAKKAAATKAPAKKAATKAPATKAPATKASATKAPAKKASAAKTATKATTKRAPSKRTAKSS